MIPRKIHVFLAVGFILVSCLLSSCIFSPKSSKNNDPVTNGKREDPTSPAKVVQNLKVAFQDLDIILYEDCLDVNYFYESPSNVDSLDITWSRSEDVSIIGNMMNLSREIIFTPVENTVYEEYGENVPDKPDGAIIDPTGEHPDDIWYICSYFVTIDVNTLTLGDFRVQQDMKFKMVRNPQTKHYSIIRWYDETPETTGN